MRRSDSYNGTTKQSYESGSYETRLENRRASRQTSEDHSADSPVPVSRIDTGSCIVGIFRQRNPTIKRHTSLKHCLMRKWHSTVCRLILIRLRLLMMKTVFAKLSRLRAKTGAGFLAPFIQPEKQTDRLFPIWNLHRNFRARLTKQFFRAAPCFCDG